MCADLFSTQEESDWPQYCCAVMRSTRGRLLVELRPPASHTSKRRLTCFGGGRERGESPGSCLRRELREELKWDETLIDSLALTPRVALRSPSRLIAWFYVAGVGLDEGVMIHPEPGYEPLWMDEGELLLDPRLSTWHAAAIEALALGRDTALVDR